MLQVVLEATEVKRRSRQRDAVKTKPGMAYERVIA